MTLENGYELKTTFNQDFIIAEAFGLDAVKDTFKKAFNEWKTNVEYCTELAIITNLRCWHWYENDKITLSKMYADYYYKVRDYALSHFKCSDFEYYYRMTD